MEVVIVVVAVVVVAVVIVAVVVVVLVSHYRFSSSRSMRWKIEIFISPPGFETGRKRNLRRLGFNSIFFEAFFSRWLNLI